MVCVYLYMDVVIHQTLYNGMCIPVHGRSDTSDVV